MARELDLVVFGATGFAGGVAAEYLARKAPKGLRWAVAGRSRDKLDRLRERLEAAPSPPVNAFQVNHSDSESVRAAVSKARAVVNYAGPFSRSGESVLAACAELGTHYLDITGETWWIRRMMERYARRAAESGAILVPFSGFDSVPSDIGAWRVAELARSREPSRPVTRVVNLISARGGVNGGTFETFLDILGLEEEEYRRFRDPALLVPGEARERFRFPEVRRPVRVKELGLTAPPFFMEPINSRVVYRSQALRLARSQEQATPFQYVELMKVSKRASAAQAWALAAGSELLSRVGRRPWGRAALRRLGVRSGQGPSEEAQRNGFFRARFLAYGGEKVLARLEMSCPGDPGNQATALLSCESALCLLEPGGVAPGVAGGFWTPSTAFGTALYRRLQAAGVQFEES